MKMRIIPALLLSAALLLAPAASSLVHAHDDDGVEVEVDDASTDEAAAAAEKEDEKFPPYTPPAPPADAIFVETFATSSSFTSHWVKSSDAKYADGNAAIHVGDTSLPDVSVSNASPHLPGDLALFVDAPARHYAFSSLLTKPHSFSSGSAFVVQYEVRFNRDHQCGGAYLKLVEHEQKKEKEKEASSFKPKEFTGDSPYSIMFGPDKCGDSDRVHFIFRFTNPVTGKTEEKHMQTPPRIKNDKYTHLYTLVLRPDNDEYEVRIDGVTEKKGSLYSDFKPAVEPPTEIDDPSDSKPADWVDDSMIVDKDDKKPTGWDDVPKDIPDPEAEKPEDWNEELDGEWEAPTIPNPAYKGEWKARMIPNPAYKGVWKPRRIPNPAHFVPAEVIRSMLPIAAVGLEIWTMQDAIEFDNIIITNSEQHAEQFKKDTFDIKHEYELKRMPKPKSSSSGESWYDRIGQLVRENLVAVIVSTFIGVVSVVVAVLLCCCRGIERPEVGNAAADAVADVFEGEQADDDDVDEHTGDAATASADDDATAAADSDSTAEPTGASAEEETETTAAAPTPTATKRTKARRAD